jgi:hypothetical protein
VTIMRTGLRRRTTWSDVEALTVELLKLEDLGRITPQAYVRRCIEARLAEAHARRQLRAQVAARPRRRKRDARRSTLTG